MPNHIQRKFVPGVSLSLLIGFLAVLWLAGGASRADALGQIVARMAAWIVLILMALFGKRTLCEARPLCWFLLATALLPLLQLAPLPPALWQSLPGRLPMIDAVGADQPWRPWSIVPGATWNALSSLAIPLAALALLTNLPPSERRWVPAILLGTILASTILGLLQFSGTGINNPLINDTPGQVSGSFANRNHFALFLAIGCLLVPVWVFQDGRRAGWRGPVGIGLLLLFVLTILASGSRAGMFVGGLAAVIVLVLAWRPLRHELRRFPRWTLPLLVVAIVGVIATFVVVSLMAGRAESINRAIVVETGEDMRSRGLPTLLEMVGTYFPAGTGFGSFDPVFRMHEPFDLLKLTYFNHAHNDFLEIVLDGGVVALAVLVAALAWWGWASLRAWRSGDTLSRIGSAILLLIFIASIVDYPARTPMMMAVIVIAAFWLCKPYAGQDQSALPGQDQQL